jgi:hypothetical protein
MAVIFTENIFTTEVNGVLFNLDSTYGLNTISLVLIAGLGTIQGSSVCPNGVTSNPVKLVLNQPLTLSASSNSVLDGIIIDGTAGIISIVGK